MRLSAFDTYCLYLAIKSHFTTQTYDYFKYHGKVKATKESFETRRDRFQFQKLSRMYTEQEMTDFLVANFIHDVRWIGNLLEDTAKDNYLQYIKRKQSFTYIFSNEVEKLFNSINDPKKAFSKDSTSYPTLITSILSNEIGYDTAAVMNYFFDYVPRFDRELGENDVIWSNMRLLILKIFPFIEFDRARIKSIIKEAINS